MEKIENSMSLTFPAKSVNEAFARNAVAIFCVPIDPTVEWIDDVKTAVSEAVTNSVVHAYPDRGDGKVTINARLDADGVHIEIIDNGTGISDIERAKQPFFTTKPDEERSGLGFTVMESLMDSVDVTGGENGGTVVKMSKRICTR